METASVNRNLLVYHSVFTNLWNDETDMKDKPEKYWDNIPREIDSPSPSEVSGVPHIKSTEERVEEERQAELYND